MNPRFKRASRLDMPGYPFAELERQAAALRAAGKPLYNLSIGDPDLPPPPFVVDAARRALDDPRSHRYPSSRGDAEVRRAVARWFRGRFGVELDPGEQVCILIGAKEGLANLARAVVNPGDTVALPDPAYPVYGRAGCLMVEGNLKRMPLDPDNGFLPNLQDAAGARLVYLNYPNNPTGATADEFFLRRLANFAESNPDVTVAYDMAYSEMTFGRPARSLLEFTGRAVEFHSLSKMANATGYRVGFAVGDPERITALVQVKEEVDSGAPLPFQAALRAVLDAYKGAEPPQEIAAARETYHHRRDLLATAIKDAGFQIFDTDATFYLWFRVGSDEVAFVSRALESGVLLTPGSGFGEGGIGWVRASVTAGDSEVHQAAELLRKMR